MPRLRYSSIVACLTAITAGRCTTTAGTTGGHERPAEGKVGQDPSTQRFVGDQSRRSVTLAQIREDDYLFVLHFRAEVAGALQMRSLARIELLQKGDRLQSENLNNTDGAHMSCASYLTLKQ